MNGSASDEDRSWEEWVEGSSLLDQQPPNEIESEHFHYVLESEIDRNGEPNEVPRSHSFKARMLTSPVQLVFIKFAPGCVIDAEWEASENIPSSPHLQRPFDRSILDGILICGRRLHFIVSEYIDGVDLFQLTNPIDQDLLFNLCAQAASALAALHAKDLVHCDIKPENLMWGDSLLRIIDFETCTETGGTSMCSTEWYCAPEVRLGKVVEQKSDIFSLGMTFFFLRVRQRPHWINWDIVNWPEDFEGILADLVREMIEYDPDRRPTAEDICRKIEGFWEKERSDEDLIPYLE
jgi:serine/threonine protein kinase